MNIKKIISMIVLFVITSQNLVMASETTGTITVGSGLEANSGLSAVVCPSASGVIKPSSIVVVPKSTSEIDISWNAIPNATSYKVYRSRSSDFTDFSLVKTTTGTTFSDSGLLSNTIYYYKINATYFICNTTIESTFATNPSFAKTMTQPVSIGVDSGSTRQALIDAGFSTSTGELLNTDGIANGSLIGDKPITLNESGTINVSIVLISPNIIESNSGSTLVELKAEAILPENTTVTFSGNIYTGVINPPVLQPNSVASELQETKNVLSVVKVGSDSGSINFSTGVTLRLPAPGLSNGDNVSIEYSVDGVNWNTLKSDARVNSINGKPYVVFTTTHFTYFAVTKSLPTCTLDDVDVSSWGTCSNSIQSATVFTKKPGRNCSIVGYTPTRPCGGGGSSGGGGGGGGGGGYIPQSTKKSTSTGTTSTGTTSTGTTSTGGNIITTPNKVLSVVDKFGRTIILKQDGTKVIIKDISKSFAKSYIETLINKGIVNGFADNTFRPEQSITRAEYLKMILRASNINYDNVDTSNCKFTDVDKTSWQAKVVKKAASLGIISSENTLFRPNDSISRAESMKMLINAFGIKIIETDKSSFSDVSGWAIKYVETAKNLGIIANNTLFRPADSISRAEVAKIIVKIIERKQ